jgi:hypothetical protein
MKILSAIQPSFLPWRGYIDIIKKSDVFIFYDHVQYDKNGWRNRNKILINRKPQWLTIPIKKDKFEKKINEVKLVDSNKNLQKIFKTIYLNYKNHTNFNKVIRLIENIFFMKEWNLLSELNIEITKKICDYYKIDTEFKLSSDLKNNKDKNLNLILLCKKFNCEKYLTGPSAKNYLDSELFKKNEIEIIWHDYIDKPYYQHKVE